MRRIAQTNFFPIVSEEDLLEKRKRHKEAYMKAIKEKLTLNICPVHLNHIGLPRSGKTSFRRRLLGDILNLIMASLRGESFQASTGLAEAGGQVFIRTMCTDIGTIQSKVWAMLQDFGEEVGMLNQFIYQVVFEAPTTTTTHSSTAAKIPPSPPPSQAIGGASGGSKPKRKAWKKGFMSRFHQPGGKAPSKKDLEETFSLISKVMEDKQWDKTKFLLEDLILLINTDTGGQAEFLELQASLVQGPSLNLLYMRLVDDLDSQFQTYYTNEEGVSTEKEDSSTTVKDVLFQALSSIACFSGSFPDSEDAGGDSTEDSLSARVSQSKAVFVGTHRDLVSEGEFRRKDQLLQSRILDTEFYERNIIEFASEDQLMLAVDNMRGGKEEIDQIRKTLERIIKRSFKKVPIPASWLMLNLCLRKTGLRTMSLRDCEELAKKLHISPKELQDALWFLHHHIGVLLYYPEIPSLRTTVICDIQVVFDSASNLIKYTFTFDKVGHRRSQQFRERAQFSLRDLKQASSEHTDDLLPLENLVDLLQNRNVLAVIPQTTSSRATAPLTPDPTYFMPCVLLSAKSNELVVANSSSDPPSLMLRYDCGYLPVGLFPALITNLVSQQREDWEMVAKGLRKNRVQFHVGVDYDTLTLISHPRFLEIALSRRSNFSDTPTQSLCAHVRSVVQSTLETVTSHLNYHFRMRYKFGFECPAHPGKP